MSDSKELDEILNEIKKRQDQFNPFENSEGKLEEKDSKDEPSSKDDDDINLAFDDKSDETVDTTDDIPSETDNVEDSNLTDTSTATSSDDVETTESALDETPFSSFDSKEEETPIAHDDYVDISSSDEYTEEDMDSSQKKKIIIAVIAIIVVIALGVGVYFGFIKKDKEPETTTTPTTASTTVAPVIVTNPLTGEADYNAKAVGKRPVACVVENSEPARPQWGIETPDIIVEGEVEGGETRMLWLFADYTSVPDRIGPMRSARPPFIRFSELFDSIFVHWGQSQSKGNYVGANTVFNTDNVDHINQMTYGGSVSLYGRDSSRNVATEHTGVLYGDKLPDAIKELKFRTDAKESNYTKFSFNEKESKVGESVCAKLALKFSARTATRDWSYSEDDKMYHSTDYKTDVKMKNLIVLFDNTTYVSKANYKGSGNSETYCDYSLAGGKGVVASNGTYTNITWSVENGTIKIADESGSDVKLNAGRSWIGYASTNNGGSVTES